MIRALLLLLALSLSSCGFHLRGHNVRGSDLPFSSLHLKYANATPFITELQTNLELYKVRMEPTAALADLTLEIVSEGNEKRILSLSGSGQVREFELRYRVSLRAYDKQMRDWLTPDEILLQRTLTYDDTQILAKEQEEALINRDMRSDAVQQVMRRLSRAKSRPETISTQK